MKIAGELTIKDWKDLEEKLAPNNDELWGLAFNFFEERIRTRYLNPINAILDLKLNNGEGFAVVNLQCSLIETIECFINGWSSEFDIAKGKTFWKNKGVIVKYPNINNSKNLGNTEIFISFFKNRKPFAALEIDGTDFFRNVRCGLLHETQTKNNWKIKKGNVVGKSYEFDGVIKIIYRDNFQKDIVALLENYKKAIIYGEVFDSQIETCELRENFKAKMKHIRDKS